MKKLLVLSTALAALVSIDATASKLTLSEAFELGTFARNNKTIDEVIGISTITGGQTNDNRNAVDDLQAAKLKLIGSTDAAIKAITRTTGAQAGISATLIDGVDYIDRAVGSETAYNAVFARSQAVVDNTIDDAGAGGAIQTGLSFDNAQGTPAIQLIDVTATNTTPGIRNAVGRMDGLLALAYRRLVRQAAVTIADTGGGSGDLAARRVRLGNIATAHGVTAGNALPSEDQFTLAMLVHFLFEADLENLK